MLCFHNNQPALARAADYENGLRIANAFSIEQLKAAKTPAEWAKQFAQFGEEALKSVVVSGGPAGINYQGQNIVPQDLEASARNFLWGDGISKLLPMLPYIEATQRQHQWARIRSFGNVRASLQMPEGGRPVGTSSRSDLASVWITTQGRLNRVTGMARAQQTINVLGSRDPFISNRAAIMRLLAVQRITHMLWSRTDNTTNGEAWRGIWQQVEDFFADSVAYPNNPRNMPDGPYRDVRGFLTRTHIEESSTYFTENHGGATHLFVSPNTARSFQGQFEAGTFTGNTAPERLQVLDADGNVTIGVPIGGINTTTGVVKFVVEKTLQPMYYHEMNGPGGFVAMEGAPAQPAVPAVNVPVGVVASSRWLVGDIPGSPTVEYRIQAFNNRGESLPSASTGAGAVTIAAGGRVQVTFASSPDADGYRILRNNPTLWTATGKGLVTFWEVGRVANTGGNITFTDYNHDVAGYEEAILVEFAHPAKQNGLIYPVDAADNALAIADLAKGMKTVQVPSFGDYEEEMIILRQHPVVHMPTRIVRFKNVKPYGA